jgi:hypothetical protein
MKINFSWHDKKGRNDFRVWPLKPSFKKYWSGQLWYFNFWKWSMIWDFREGNFITWALDEIKKRRWSDILKGRNN